MKGDHPAKCVPNVFMSVLMLLLTIDFAHRTFTLPTHLSSIID